MAACHQNDQYLTVDNKNRCTSLGYQIMCLLCFKFSSENNDRWDIQYKAMQETALCSELHPTVLCQNNHCKVVLKDVNHATFTSPSKFKSSFRCNFMNSTLNGGFHPRDSKQIIHNYAQVKDKFSRDILRKRLIKTNIHNKLMLSQTNHQISSGSKLNEHHKISVHQKHHTTNGGVELIQDSSAHNLITNGFCHLKSNVTNGHDQPDRISYRDDFVGKKHIRNSVIKKSPCKEPYNRYPCLNPQIEFVTPCLVSENGHASSSPKKVENCQEQNKSKSEHSVLNHRKHVKLKDDTDKIVTNDTDKIGTNDTDKICTNDTDKNLDDDCEMEHVLRSLQRLPFLQNWNENKVSVNSSITKKLVELTDTCFDIRVNRKQSIVACQSKNMRSSPESYEYESPFQSFGELQSNNTESGVCLCEWHECDQRFNSVETLTRHVKIEHIQSAKNNDVFICLWDNCKFSNQPSCSFKWLQKHVIGHCDLKPFKCVIFGCDMTFVTQNGLARHVPTHFNESRVRRACVITSETVSKELLSSKTKRCLPPASPATSADTDESRSVDLNKDLPYVSRLERFVQQNVSKRVGLNRRTCSTIKARVQRATSTPHVSSGYIGRDFRIDHKVIGRRSLSRGGNHVLFAPTLNNLFPHQSFWYEEQEFRKRKLTTVDIKVKDMSNDVKNALYEREHTSRRRTKKRKQGRTKPNDEL